MTVVRRVPLLLNSFLYLLSRQKRTEPDMSFEDSVLVEQHGFIFPNANGAKESFQSFTFENISSNIDVIDVIDVINTDR